MKYWKILLGFIAIGSLIFILPSNSPDRIKETRTYSYNNTVRQYDNGLSRKETHIPEPTKAPERPKQTQSIISQLVYSVQGQMDSNKNAATAAVAFTPFASPFPSPRPSATVKKIVVLVNTPKPKATAATTPKPGTKYVLNKSTKKFHKPTCGDVKKMKDSNRVDYFGTRQEVVNMGYKPCGHCSP